MRQNERDHLRVLAVDELGELLRIGLLQRVEGSDVGAQGLDQAVEQPPRRIRAEGADQDLAGVVQAALEHVVVRDGHLVELLEDRFGLFVSDLGDARDLAADFLNLLLVELLENLGAGLVSQDHQQNGRLLDPGHPLIGVLRVQDHASDLHIVQPGPEDLRRPNRVFLHGLGDMLGQHLGLLGSDGREPQRAERLCLQALLGRLLLGQARLEFFLRCVGRTRDLSRRATAERGHHADVPLPALAAHEEPHRHQQQHAASDRGRIHLLGDDALEPGR